MTLPRLSLLLFVVFTVATGLLSVSGAWAQGNAGKPVLSAPPRPTPQTDAPSAMPVAPSSSIQPIQPTGQVPGQAAGQGQGQPMGRPDPSADASAAPAGSSVAPSAYIIGPDDTIVVSVWKEPSLSGALPVRPDGMISLALVGDLQAAGFTPMQLAQDITTRLRKFVNDPNVTITVTGVNSKRIFLMGEVGHTGPQPLTSGLTPLSAIATAGGISAFANGKHIYILRTVSGKQMKIPFDYKKAIKTGDQQGVQLQSGDTIVVP